MEGLYYYLYTILKEILNNSQIVRVFYEIHLGE